MSLTPMLCYKDNIAMVSVRFLTEHVFTPSSGVRRGTFIEDTFGKNFQMRSWLLSAACAAKGRAFPFTAGDQLERARTRHRRR
jgi:hypothetical protein